MTLARLLRWANQSYCQCGSSLLPYFDSQTGQPIHRPGDALALTIVREIEARFDESADADDLNLLLDEVFAQAPILLADAREIYSEKAIER